MHCTGSKDLIGFFIFPLLSEDTAKNAFIPFMEGNPMKPILSFNRSFNRLMVLLIVLTLVLAPVSASFARDDNLDDDDLVAGKMVGDLVVVRPLGFCMVILGTAVFVVSLPFTAPAGNTGEAFQALMAEPARFTFARPLGTF